MRPISGFRRSTAGRSLISFVLVFLVCLAVHPSPGRADDAWGIFIVDGVRYANIGAAYAACTAAAYSRCEIWDYNLIVANGGAGEAMNSLPWDPNGSTSNGYVPFELHLGPGTLKICDAGCSTGFTFVVPRLSKVTGAGRTSDTLAGGTVIQAGSSFPTTGHNTLVRIGDADNSNSFGTLLSSVTVDCNYKSGCGGIENSSAQEQSGLEHVNVVNYSYKGIYIHGPYAQNSHYTDVEVNGCLSSASCIIGTTPVIGATTVPLEIDNVPALRPIVGITVNPVDTVNSNIASVSWSATPTPARSTYTVGSTNGFAVGNYVSIQNVAPAATVLGSNFNGTFPIYAVVSGTVFSVAMPNPGYVATSNTGNAALVPEYDVLVCSGSSCTDSTVSPTTVTFVGPHFEHAQYGIDAQGQGTTLNLIGGSCPNIYGGVGAYSDVATCAQFESLIVSGHVENFYPGPATASSLTDNNFSYTTLDNFIQLYDIGAADTNSHRTRHCSETDCTDQVFELDVKNSGSATNGLKLTDATISTLGSAEPLLLAPTGFVEVDSAGTAAAPSLVLTDTTTGFSRPAANEWGFSSNGTGQFLFSGQGILLNGGADIYQFGPSYNAAADTGISRDGAGGLIAVGAGTTVGDESAFIRSAGPCRITAVTSVVTTGTTLCTFYLPAVAKAWYLSCNFLWGVSAGTSPSISFGVNAQQTPTGTTHMAGSILTNNTNSGVEGSVSLSSSGALTVVTASVGTSATSFQASMFGTLLASSTAGTFTVTATGTGTGFTGAISSGGCVLQ
jgi:hypothetical protein